MRGSTAMIEKERQSELIRKFVVSQEMPDDEIGDLSLDELTYIYFNTEIAKKDEKYKAIHFPIKQQIIIGVLSMRLRKQRHCMLHLQKDRSIRILIRAEMYGCFQQRIT